jgi:hypothetical protein
VADGWYNACVVCSAFAVSIGSNTLAALLLSCAVCAAGGNRYIETLQRCKMLTERQIKNLCNKVRSLAFPTIPCAALRCAVWRVRAAEIILRCVMCTAEMMVCYVACTAEIMLRCVVCTAEMMVCYVACTAEIMLRCVVWCVQLTETIAVDRDHSLQLAALFNLHSAECAAVVKVRPCSPVDSPSGLDASA